MKAYIDFVSKYGRNYASVEETHSRYKIFKENFEKITEHNKNEVHLPFNMEVNQFTDLTELEF
jgi:hypothetical protein